MRLVTKIALLALASGMFTASSARAQSALTLNEFCAGPARDWDGNGTFSSRDDEWIEIRNGGAAPLDLTGYLITDGDKIPRYAPSGVLAAGERLTIFGATSVEWERAFGYPVFGLSLANAGDQVMLWQVVAGDTVLVDSYQYKSHEAASDRAVGRLPDGGAWSLFDGLNPYSGTTAPLGNGCVPTPGAPNLCGATETKHSTWGRLKALYR